MDGQTDYTRRQTSLLSPGADLDDSGRQTSLLSPGADLDDSGRQTSLLSPGNDIDDSGRQMSLLSQGDEMDDSGRQTSSPSQCDEMAGTTSFLSPDGEMDDATSFLSPDGEMDDATSFLSPDDEMDDARWQTSFLSPAVEQLFEALRPSLETAEQAGCAEAARVFGEDGAARWEVINQLLPGAGELPSRARTESLLPALRALLVAAERTTASLTAARAAELRRSAARWLPFLPACMLQIGVNDTDGRSAAKDGGLRIYGELEKTEQNGGDQEVVKSRQGTKRTDVDLQSGGINMSEADEMDEGRRRLPPGRVDGAEEEYHQHRDASELAASRLVLDMTDLTAAIDRALGNVLLLATSRVPPLLKDILSAPPLTDILGPVPVHVLQLLLGPPCTLNLRNLLWHGFVAPRQLPAGLLPLLQLLTAAVGQLLSARQLSPRQQVSYSQSLLGQLRRPALTAAQLADLRRLVDASPFVPLVMRPHWHLALSLYRRQRYAAGLQLLLPQLEHTLRLAFCRRAGCARRRRSAQHSSLYTTLDLLVSERRHGVLALCGRGPLLRLCDLLVWPAGPRLRDRLAHAELEPAQLPPQPAHQLLWLVGELLLTAHPERWHREQRRPRGVSGDEAVKGVGGSDERISGRCADARVPQKDCVFSTSIGDCVESEDGMYDRSTLQSALYSGSQYSRMNSWTAGLEMETDFVELCSKSAIEQYHPSFHQFSLVQRTILELFDALEQAFQAVRDRTSIEPDGAALAEETSSNRTDLEASSHQRREKGMHSSKKENETTTPVDDSDEFPLEAFIVTASPLLLETKSRAAALRPDVLRVSCRRQAEQLTRLQLLVTQLRALWQNAAAAEARWRERRRLFQLHSRSRATWRRMREALPDLCEFTMAVARRVVDTLENIEDMAADEGQLSDRDAKRHRRLLKTCENLASATEARRNRWLEARQLALAAAAEFCPSQHEELLPSQHEEFLPSQHEGV